MAVLRYKNLSRKSSVYLFESGRNFIRVQFLNSPNVYQYSYQKAGQKHVEMMKRLAVRGIGLNTYIKTVANNLYD